MRFVVKEKAKREEINRKTPKSCHVVHKCFNMNTKLYKCYANTTRLSSILLCKKFLKVPVCRHFEKKERKKTALAQQIFVKADTGTKLHMYKCIYLQHVNLLFVFITVCRNVYA